MTGAGACAKLAVHMRSSHPADPRQRLLPEGRRWGFGAHSVLPYLTALHTRSVEPAHDGEPIRNPVFPHMDPALRTLRRRH